MFNLFLDSSAAMCHVVLRVTPINPDAPFIIWLILGLLMFYVFCTIIEHFLKRHQRSEKNNILNNVQNDGC